ncbi:MAG TPA: DUF6801 domain-containing protein [Amycolatopsis sp.]|uniref:DUF6801 domain-containing protein n=1 Tax=Amycolatopsis sp. TaxID=37632 RepID=UPI002B49D156|nr:DUF6801 domain-containing protein [Amycolatopsis sp.]HKS45921.1 DUF6801 domain-containing protein [Amycolatopsis sp.]
MPRARVAAAAAVGVIVAGGVAAGAPATELEQTIAVKLAYTCRFPAGPQNVSADVTGTFPRNGKAGVAIQPKDVQVAVTVPQSVLDAASVSGTARLTVDVAQVAQEESAGAVWDLGIPLTAAPENTALEIIASGAVPDVKAGRQGDVTFTATGLDLELDKLSVRCAPAPDQNARLAVVGVFDRTPSKAPSSAPPSSPGRPRTESGIEVGRNPAGTMSPQSVRAPAIDAPPGCFTLPAHTPSTQLGCAYEAGFSNVNKQHASVLFGGPTPGLLKLAFSEVSVGGLPCDSRFPPWFGQDGYTTCFVQSIHSRAELDMPAADSSVLTFGFMPVRAKVRMVPTQDISIDALQQTRRYPKPPINRTSFKVTATTVVNLVVSDVKVNGVLLDVGPDCRTATPVTVTLSGSAANANAPTADEYTVQLGGPLTGFADIPGFTGCGVTENLDPLLTGTISGPGNYLKMTQGKPCFTQGAVCPPTLPVPRR